MRRLVPRAMDGQGCPVRWSSWLGGLAGVCLALVLWAPSHWLVSSLVRVTGPGMQLVQPRGTVWRGSAQLLLAPGQGRGEALLVPGRLHWQLRLQAWGIEADVRADCCMQVPLNLSARWWRDGWSLRVGDQQSRWPAGLLSRLGMPWSVMQLEGPLEVRSEGLQLHAIGGPASQWRLQGLLMLQARELTSGLVLHQPLGSFRLELRANGDGPTPCSLNLSTLRGPLQLRGQGSCAMGRGSFSGQAHAEPGYEAALANFLNLIGRRDGAHTVFTF